jgi:hypothetical protein
LAGIRPILGRRRGNARTSRIKKAAATRKIAAAKLADADPICAHQRIAHQNKPGLRSEIWQIQLQEGRGNSRVSTAKSEGVITLELISRLKGAGVYVSGELAK